jgi:hypothetical protein
MVSWLPACPASVQHNLEITQGGRVWIMSSINYQLHGVQADLFWLDQQIAISTKEEGSDTRGSRSRAQ